MAKTGTNTSASTGTARKKQNVFADDEDQQPNSAYNKAVEAAKIASTPIIAEATRDEASVVTNAMAPATVAPTAGAQKDQELPLPASQSARKPENQKADRAGAGYTKATHRIHDDAFQALEDMKLLLKRKYGFKRILLEEIVEEAILGIKRDLDEHKEQSILVQRLREQKLPENQ